MKFFPVAPDDIMDLYVKLNLYYSYISAMAYAVSCMLLFPSIFLCIYKYLCCLNARSWKIPLLFTL